MNTSTNLPKDVGLCENCQTANSRSATKCRSCMAVLPWAQKKVAKTQGRAPQPPPMQQPMMPPPMPQAGPPQPSWPGQTPPAPRPDVTFLPPLPKPTLSDHLNNLDWGGTIVFLFLFLGVMVLSAALPFLGIRMYLYFNSDGNALQYAALAGLVLLGLLVVFFGAAHGSRGYRTTY